MMINQKTSRTIMVANLIAMIMIIAIHYHTRGHALSRGSVWGWNYLVQEFLTNGLARTAVPYFALISGFFLFSQFSGPGSYKRLLRNKFHSWLIPYMSAATIIFMSVALAKLLKGNDSLWNIHSMFHGILITPLSVQFWFLRDLLMLAAISPLLLPKNRFLQIALGLGLFFLWLLEVQILPIVGDWHIINMETLFFFYLGGQLSCRGDVLNAIVDSNKTCTLLTSLLLTAMLITRISVTPTIDIWYNPSEDYPIPSLILYKATIVIGIICLIQISSIFHHSSRLIYLSGLTFFAFLFHHVPLSSVIAKITELIVAKEFGFYLSFPMATATVFGAAYIMAENIPKLYGILCGDRSPGKTLGRIQSSNPLGPTQG
jgi:surface polysaccharide O-acyltransferase-like enzyme